MFRRDRKQRQLSFADLSNAGQAVPADHLLIRMRESVRWDLVEQQLKASYAEGPVGRPGWSLAMLVRMLLLQEYADLSDREVEEQVGCHLLYRAFVGLSAEDLVPDATTLVRFRARIQTEGMRRVFAEVNRQWEAAGLIGADRRVVDGVHLWAKVACRSWATLVEQLGRELVEAVLREEGPARADVLQRCVTLTSQERDLRGAEWMAACVPGR